ncbi:hypothetical protein AB9P05_02315 [Roseivirga sp. BDSF3-8]|uniref:hypothetical protein n=1 Tax=Roseivirga sp. BDSF3-8 TaxID=3241598 RepID=UPI003531B035
MKKEKLSLDQLRLTSFVTVPGMRVHGGVPPNHTVIDDKYPDDPEWEMGTRGGCTHYENMCNETNYRNCA